MNTDVLHIQDYDELTLKDAYRTLPREGEVNLYGQIRDLDIILQTMESAGFIGIEVININSTSGSMNIRAYKGKSGPCYHTGRVALYKGAALAALDDDNHLLLAGKKVSVCEKTARIYKLTGYRKLVACTEGDPDLKAALDSDPVIFNCDSLENDYDELHKMLQDAQPGIELSDLFYPGPFRLLILKDGRVIKRGRNSLVPASFEKQLKNLDNLFKLKNIQSDKIVFFQEIHAQYGSRCLLDIIPVDEVPAEKPETDLSALNKLSPEIKGQLLKLINANKKFFVLIGSDVGDKLGCCPSEVVTAANRLAAAGVLESYRQPVPGETCPVTVYAFRNEMQIKDHDLVFEINENLRKIILDKLNSKTNYSFRHIARLILLPFLIITLTIAFLRIFDSSKGQSRLSLYEQLEPWSRNQEMILLFHYTERCTQCLNMEKFTRELLGQEYQSMLANKEIQFKLVEMDQPENRIVYDHYCPGQV
jgi:hypothetical protein